MGLTEHTGHGIPTIIETYGREVFEIEDNYIRCTIQFDNRVLESITTGNVGLNVGLNNTETYVLNHLDKNSNLTADDLANQLGVSKRTIERAFKSLQEKNLIKRVGSKRDGYWLVIKEKTKSNQ